LEGAFGGSDVWRCGGKEDLRCGCFGMSRAKKITLCAPLYIGEIFAAYSTRPESEKEAGKGVL
jgi:hypothetical protein